MHFEKWYIYAINSLIAALIVIWMLKRPFVRPGIRKPGKFQTLMELLYGVLKDLFTGALGENGAQHLPLVMALFYFILVANILGQVPLFHSATASASVTMGLALIVFFYVQYVGIKSKGLLGYLRHFLGPLLILAPLFILIEVIGELAKPISLGMRLFGNIYGEDVINAMALTAGSQIYTPVQTLVYFLQLFTDLIQAFIFAILTCAYISIMSVHHEDNGDAHDPKPHRESREERFEESMISLGGGRVTPTT